jgi:hypothetical protein
MVYYETPGSMYSHYPHNTIDTIETRRHMYGEQTKNKNKAESF